MYGHSFFLKFKSYRLHFCNKKIEFLIIFDCTLPLKFNFKKKLPFCFSYE